MINIQIIDLSTLIAFWLVFSRSLAVILQLPLFDQVSIPFNVKILMTFVLSYALFPVSKEVLLSDIKIAGENAFWILTIFHVLVGLVIGFFVRSIMFIFTSAGSLITQQIGLNALSFFDPQAGATVGPFEKLIEWTLLMMIVTSGALLPMLKGIVLSLDAIKLHDFAFAGLTKSYFLDFFKSVFTSAIMLASPMIFINLIINVTMGIISRLIPQMNIVAVSFAVNIGLGLLVFIAGSEEFFDVCFNLYTEKLAVWFKLIT